ncbi:hypothetical protein [Bacillus velezensis]|uniref:hypothetical protein n=1 Tax=Bacillus velezensis TaxID=492670 RepID=UPI001EFBF9A1|nr:hypothetical protein [Bacillus velezensis]ULN60203.1 hypothetical protein MID02_16175 [Bacillus velezensis]ULN60248.1 hypothetical protein MID02_16415 [Bacillus velezensis]
MGIQMIKRVANGHLVWDEEKKKSLLISNYEANRHDEEQSTTKDSAADKTEGKTTKGTKGKAPAKEKETADSQ